MTVDVEDYFQVSAMEPVIRREQWDAMPCRVERNVERVLDLFARRGVRATFFTLGWIAERYPAMVRRIADAGHEIASHGMAHHRVTTQDPDSFRDDVRRSRRVLEDTAGLPVRGYRAASFSLTRDTGWAHQILAEEGYAYSSSVYPIRHDHYGIPDAPRAPYRPLADADFLEVPISTFELFGRRLPCGGGGYFRLFPYLWTAHGIRRGSHARGRPAVFYFHPWEVDPHQPRIRGTSLRTRIRHYTNLARMERKLARLLGAFRWDRMDAIFLRATGD
ncbi:MAG: XrtA system polysaccharide deacetylase [Rhodothalassiaceae bacterium]